MCLNYPIHIPESSLQNKILRNFVNVMWPAWILTVALNGLCFNWVWHPCYRRFEHIGISLGKPEGRAPFGGPEVDEGIISKYILKNFVWENVTLNSSGSRHGRGSGSYKHGNETVGSIKLRNYWFDSAPGSYIEFNFHIIYLSTIGFYPGGSSTTIGHNRQVTHTQSNNTFKQNTIHKTQQ
jgi:hypothetical protein